MKKIRIAYFGTPDFSAHVLEKLLNDRELPISVEYVVTQPDRPVGRKQLLTASPVKQVAQSFSLPIEHEINLKRLHAVDLVLLFAYGKIITSQQLLAPKYGFWNIHLSLLPAFRGATPTVFPIMLGHTQTGTTLTKMDAELDHGPLIAQHPRTIEPHIRNNELISLLADDSYELFKQTILYSHSLERIEMQPQNHTEATYTPILSRNDGFVQWKTIQAILNGQSYHVVPAIMRNYRDRNHLSHIPDFTGEMLYNMWRSLYPWPGIWTYVEHEKRMKLLECEYKNGIFSIIQAQIEGKNPASFAEIAAKLDL